jgi:phage tail protein X
MTNNVLAELGFAGLEPVTTNSQAQRQSTSDILAGIEAATGQRSILDERETLEAIVIAALRAGESDESDESIDLIVNTAAASGDLAVPGILVTSNRRVDTFVLLNNIVTQARIAAGGAAPAIPDVTPDNTAGMEVRIIQRATDEIEARFYTVQSGDSLGAISIKFYGVIGQYETIFEANKGLLSSPDRIRVGQRLVIPQLDA